MEFFIPMSDDDIIDIIIYKIISIDMILVMQVI